MLGFFSMDLFVSTKEIYKTLIRFHVSENHFYYIFLKMHDCGKVYILLKAWCSLSTSKTTKNNLLVVILSPFPFYF